VTETVTLFDPQEIEKQKAGELLERWENNPNKKPNLRVNRDDTLKKRIIEALDGGFRDEVIVRALDECWKMTSKPAWATALKIAQQKIEHEQENVRLTETQKALLRLEQRHGLFERP